MARQLIRRIALFQMGAALSLWAVPAAWGAGAESERPEPPPCQSLRYEDRHLSFTASYSHFFAGPFLHRSGKGDDVDFFTAWGTYRF